MTTTEKKEMQRQQKLQDRQDYRRALIERQNAIGAKIAAVEKQIKALKDD